MRTIFGMILLFSFAAPVLADIPPPPRFDGTEMVECIIQKSVKPLPVFNPPRRMG